jgi:hypothetical protein
VLSPASLPFPKLQLQASGNDSDNGGDEKEDNDPDGGTPSFVDDSPMKPAANGKAFTFLFEETIKPTPTVELFGNDVPVVKAQSNGKRPRNKLPSMDEDIFSDHSKSNKGAEKSSMKTGPSVKSQSSALTKSRSKLIQTTLPVVGKSSNQARKRSPSETHTATKRVLPEDEHAQNDMAIDDDADMTSPSEKPSTITQLLPPSPNPNASRSGKSKPNGARSNQPPKTTSRKKAKLQDSGHGMTEDMENDDGSNSDGFNAHHSVKLVHHSRGIRAALPTEEANSEIDDPILNYANRVEPQGQGLVSPMKQGGNGNIDAAPKREDVDEEEDSTVIAEDEKAEGNLSNELCRVLVLESLKAKQNEYEEEKIVKRLLSGRRVLHYDPKKGGEIWGVGEDETDEFAEDQERRFDEGTDDWEGNPVPWEVGELSESHYHLEEL